MPKHFYFDGIFAILKKIWREFFYLPKHGKLHRFLRFLEYKKVENLTVRHPFFFIILISHKFTNFRNKSSRIEITKSLIFSMLPFKFWFLFTRTGRERLKFFEFRRYQTIGGRSKKCYQTLWQKLFNYAISYQYKYWNYHCFPVVNT